MVKSKIILFGNEPRRQKNFIKITGITLIPSTILILAIAFLSPMLTAPGIATAQSSPTTAEWSSWQANMAKTSPSGEGCFEADYPSSAWQQVQCSPASSKPHTVGNGNDWVAKAPSGKLIASSSSGSISTSGLTSEKDVNSGSPNTYGLQINSNSGFPVTFYGKSTKGWEQFLFDNQGSTTPVGPPYGNVFIEYWLFGYATTYGKCPPASEDPPGGGSGWFNDGSGNCYFNTSGPTFTPDVAATNLNLVTFSATSNLKMNSKDTTTLCIFLGKCYTKSISDSVLHLYKHWTKSEFNIFGICCLTEAIFNKGTTINLENILEDQTGSSFGTPTCLKGGFTGETNNLNLGTCSKGSTYIAYSESN